MLRMCDYCQNSFSHKQKRAHTHTNMYDGKFCSVSFISHSVCFLEIGNNFYFHYAILRKISIEKVKHDVKLRTTIQQDLLFTAIFQEEKKID